MSSELSAEQSQVDAAYSALDSQRERAAQALVDVRRTRAGGGPAAQSERDAFAALHEQRLRVLNSIEDRLVFGRLDLVDATRYVGRLGLSDQEQTQIVVDWRAPAAEPFYRATASEPMGVVRRRHIATSGRTVTGIDDDVLDVDAFDAADADALVGDGALLTALNAARSTQMRDIVATIQAEQDAVIRAPLAGVLVVQGGPGTGKTAVALHRAAYLLYAHRERIEKSGVLLVGPNSAFLRYISAVLPALGETGVVMMTPGSLLPGVEATARDDAPAAAVKGDLRMVDVLARAVAQRQRVPARALALRVDEHQIWLRPHDVERARARARGTGLPHNEARITFVRAILQALARKLARATGVEADHDTLADLVMDLRDSADVRREVNLAWMPLSPQRVLADLYAHPRLLETAAPRLSASQRSVLQRPAGSVWTVDDVPLLDELAELLGEDPEPSRRVAALSAAQRADEIRYAQGVLASSGAGGMVSAEMLADRFSDYGPVLTVAERAAGDRAWTYGHVVVDEAQELSAMAWRSLMRRSPSRSITAVGDIAQTSSAAGATSWGQMLDPYVEGRWTLAELTVNYRTPGQIMDLAHGVLEAAGVALTRARSARTGDHPPVVEGVSLDDLSIVRAYASDELAAVDGGTVVVICPREMRTAVAAALDGVDAEVLTSAEVKGLEFDAVVLVEPSAILAKSPRGANDLYVALSRPTQRLTVLHSGVLPPGLSDGAQAGDV